MTSEESFTESNSCKMTGNDNIPNGWKVVNLGCIARINMGQSPPSSTYNECGNGIPFFQGNGDFGRTYPSVKMYTSKPIKKAYSNEILMSVRAPVGVLNICNVECCIGRGLCSIDASHGENTFLYYMLMLKNKELNEKSTGSTFKGINKSSLESLNIPLPPLPEQHKIASILSKVDEHISHTEAIIEKTEELKKGLMQQLLTKGIGHTKFKNTEVGEIPEEWDVRSLPHVFDVIDYRGRTPPFSDNGIPYIGADNIKNESIVFSNRRYVSDKTYEQYMTRGIPNPGDILFTTEAPLGKVAQAPNYKFCLAQRLVAFQCKNDYDPTFFMYILKSDVVQKQFIDWSTGTTVKGISAKNMKFIKLSCPRDVTEQKRIGRILSQVDDQLSQNQTYLSQLQELKKGLMQDLLTGKVRVGS